MSDWNRLRIFAARSWMQDGIVLRVYQQTLDGHRSYCSGVTMTELQESTIMLEPPSDPLVMDMTAAQELMDGLWACGVRPTEGTGSAGQAQAMQKHISDLEKVNDKLLGIVDRVTTTPTATTRLT